MDYKSGLKEKYRGLIDRLDRVQGIKVSLGEPMSLHATMRTGGPADIFLEPCSEEALIAAAEALNSKNIPWIAVGNCSNIIVKDGGYRGAVISLVPALTGIEASPAQDGAAVMKAGAGEPLSKLAAAAAAASLTGLEFAAGIPGSVGGAVYMNAGAYGGEIKDCLTEVRCFRRDSGGQVVLSAEDARLGYRTSIFKSGEYIILEAAFALRCGVREEIDRKTRELFERRNARQPVELPSSGSFFKRPEGHYAGKLIEEAGMKGFSSGAAEVSPKHAGFIVNTGGATTADVLAVADAVRREVEAKSGVALEAEPVIIGEDIREGLS
ncbi:MAG: UDP-N-acetylmuramate dehydrogenase [Clostridiales Family XIII bacterium]|nr:UDP-N-acetylmuramate dehydrogenase [Clostridiales Family XIII bacterium]